MLRHVTWSAAALAFLMGANAAAQTLPTAPVADPPMTVVPASERLTFGDVFADADIVMQLVMGGLLLATVMALAIWLFQAASLRKGGGRGLAGAMAYLSGLGAAGPLIGFFGACYTLLHSFIGVANVRPTPSLTIMAPGFAEALLAAMLGLLAASVAVVGHRHLKARVHGLDMAPEGTLSEGRQTLSRHARAGA
jgi:biopolymer transport protein ExbB/TolQ